MDKNKLGLAALFVATTAAAGFFGIETDKSNQRRLDAAPVETQYHVFMKRAAALACKGEDPSYTRLNIKNIEDFTAATRSKDCKLLHWQLGSYSKDLGL